MALVFDEENVNTNGSDDEYEEITLVADLKGVLDPSTVVRALNQNNVALRFANTERPVIQVGSSMFTGEWTKTMGTDLIYETEKAPLAVDDKEKKCEFVSCSSTRLTASKAITQTQKQ